jgi:hypothetical protein
VLSGADPLNLIGILTPDARVAAIHRNRVVLKDGVPIAALESGELRRLGPSELGDDALKALAARPSHRPLHPYLRVLSSRKPKPPSIVRSTF